MTLPAPTADESARSWRDVIDHFDQSVTKEGYAGDRPVLEFARRIADTAYAHDVHAWISRGLCFAPRSHFQEPRANTMGYVSVTNHGLLDFRIRRYPSGHFLLKRLCEPTEADRVFASAVLRMKLDRGPKVRHIHAVTRAERDMPGRTLEQLEGQTWPKPDFRDLAEKAMTGLGDSDETVRREFADFIIRNRPTQPQLP